MSDKLIHSDLEKPDKKVSNGISKLTKSRTTGLVLSGGGARGFATLGALKALDEQGFKPDMISGVSAGAIAAAFYASGLKPEEIFELMDHKQIYNFIRFRFPKRSFFYFDGFKNLLGDYFGEMDLRELNIPVVVAAVNLNDGKVIYFRKGKIRDILLATASIPILFPPVEIEGKLYSDGGILDNLPAWPIRQKCDFILGINANPVEYQKDFGSLISISERILKLLVKEHADKFIHLCDEYVLLENLEDYNLFDFSRRREIFEKGYAYMKTKINESRILQGKHFNQE